MLRLLLTSVQASTQRRTVRQAPPCTWRARSKKAQLLRNRSRRCAGFAQRAPLPRADVARQALSAGSTWSRCVRRWIKRLKMRSRPAFSIAARSSGVISSTSRSTDSAAARTRGMTAELATAWLKILTASFTASTSREETDGVAPLQLLSRARQYWSQNAKCSSFVATDQPAATGRANCSSFKDAVRRNKRSRSIAFSCT